MWRAYKKGATVGGLEKGFSSFKHCVLVFLGEHSLFLGERQVYKRWAITARMHHMRADTDDHTACWLPHLAAHSSDTMLKLFWTGVVKEQSCIHTFVSNFNRNSYAGSKCKVLPWTKQIFGIFLTSLRLHAHRSTSISNVATLHSAVKNLITAVFSFMSDYGCLKKERESRQCPLQ